MAPRGQTENPNVGGTGGHSFANVTHQLKGIDFPANKKDLIQHAKRNHAPKEVMDELEGFEERQYGSMADVMKAYGTKH